MKRIARPVLAVALMLSVLLPTLSQGWGRALAQDDARTTFAFRDLNFNELILSSVYLLACNSFPASSGTIDLQSFERATGVCWSGSGTVMDPSGLILTNAHVALNQSQTEPVWVLVHRTIDSRSLPQPAFFARAILYSPAWGARQSFGQSFLDLAVLEPTLTLDGSPIQPGEVTMRPLPMAPEEGTVSIGDELRNIGYPGIGGALITVTEGSVSGFEPDNDVQALGNAGWIKTDATLGGGISGGTSINEDGFQIGVPTEAGGRDVRTICEDENGNMVPCNIGQLNHIRPVPEGFRLLQEVGLGEGLPRTGTDSGNSGGDDLPVNADGVTVIGSIVSADTGQPVAGAWFIVLEPGVAVADYLNGAQDTVYTFATSGGDGRFQLKKAVERGQAYGVVVVARGYTNTQEDGRVLAPSDAPPVVTLPPIAMASQR